MLLPGVPWRGGLEFEHDPYRALLDTHRARQILNWAPQYRWRPDRSQSHTALNGPSALSPRICGISVSGDKPNPIR